jgi:hypothetical protein
VRSRGKGAASGEGKPGGVHLTAGQDALATASKDVRSVGMETVGGVSTTHYRGTFTMQDALAKTTMTYTAFNVPLSITAPPKSQVADGSDLLGGGGANLPA